jgi:hypothetical protein
MLGIVGEPQRGGMHHLGFMIFGHMTRKKVNFKCIWRGKSYKIRQ